MYQKFLVCRADAVRPAGTMRQSNHFPMIVDIEIPRHTEREIIQGYMAPDVYERAVRAALDSISESYHPEKEYFVMPLFGAKVVSFRRPQPVYETHVRSYN